MSEELQGGQRDYSVGVTGLTRNEIRGRDRDHVKGYRQWKEVAIPVVGW